MFKRNLPKDHSRPCQCIGSEKYPAQKNKMEARNQFKRLRQAARVVPVATRDLGAGEARQALANQICAVQAAPDNESPTGTMPQAAHQKHQEDVETTSCERNSV